MDYKKKYYKEIESQADQWRLEIWQNTDDSITAIEIGPVLQSMRLIVQGDQADIDTPIIKTSLELVFVDAPDLDDDRKCGYWEEFYTSSAVEYKVLLYKNNTLEWSGFVTPDSFSEVLQYRGSVTIIARDNLGALQDIDCNLNSIANADGRARAYQIVDYALKKSGIIAMDYILSLWSNLNRRIPECDKLGKYEASSTLWYQMFDITALDQGNIYDALEKVLYSLGAVLRYVGGNKFVISTLRDMPLGQYDFWPEVPTLPIQFVSYGHRELSPAIKSIAEEISFNEPQNKEGNNYEVWLNNNRKACN